MSKRRPNLQKRHDSEKPSGNGKYVFVGCMFRSYICTSTDFKDQVVPVLAAEYPEEADLVPLPLPALPELHWIEVLLEETSVVSCNEFSRMTVKGYLKLYIE